MQRGFVRPELIVNEPSKEMSKGIHRTPMPMMDQRIQAFEGRENSLNK